MLPTRLTSRRTYPHHDAHPATPLTSSGACAAWLRASRLSVRAPLREVALVLTGTAVIALVGQLRLPLPFTPVPVSLGTLAVLGVGAAVGPARGAASAALLALLAAAGLPVLTGWQGGIGATFGYVLGYLLAAAVAGRAARRSAGASGRSRGSVRARLAGAAACLGLMLVASALVYVPGTAWLAAWTGVSLGQAVVLGVVPFLAGDLLKSLIVAGAVTLLPPALGRNGDRRHR